MSVYYTEGYIKTLSKGYRGITFTLEATAPYLFEIKETGKEVPAKRKVLLVDDENNIVRIEEAGAKFTMPKAIDFIGLLIAKTNHIKVRLTADPKRKEQGSDIARSTEAVKQEFISVMELEFM